MPTYEDNLFTPPAPLAKVTLRDRNSSKTISDVPLLIDTGADVTLIPQMYIDFLGVSVDANETYELIGFNDSRILMQAVELDLIFLKTIFNGKFFIINQDIGILGRKVLNEISLLLDGPNLTWSEQ